jgi:hypothetical protein
MTLRTLDIFRQLPDGAPVCVEAVLSLEHAKQRLAELSSTKPGPYAVYDVQLWLAGGMRSTVSEPGVRF